MAGPDAQAREDQFLGALLGLAIGDALGRPLRGLSGDEIAAKHGVVSSYIAAGTSEDGRPLQGEISDKSEIALCIVESLTTNDGLIDPENINARLSFLAAGASSQWMSEQTRAGIALAGEHDGLVPETSTAEPELAVGVRGVPIGLLHAVGGYNDRTLEVESALVSRLSHGGRAQALLTAEIARAINVASRTRSVMRSADIHDSPSVLVEFSRVLEVLGDTGTFLEGVSTSIGLGGETDSIGALAGAIAGARFGASGIPQDLIDGLDARIYLTLAAPWFYRTALRRAGTVIDLRLVQ